MKKPKAGSRMAQTRVDYSEKAREKARSGLKRTVTDKSTGAKVFPLKDYNNYQRLDKAALDARVDFLTPAKKKAIKSKGKKP